MRIQIEAFALDSTSVKVHPDGAGAYGIPLLMDKAYEDNLTRQLVLDLGMIPVVPPK